MCDEPTSALDAKTGHTILELLRNVAVEGDRAVIIVTHDSRIFEFADTMARMDDGHIESIERRTERESGGPWPVTLPCGNVRRTSRDEASKRTKKVRSSAC